MRYMYDAITPSRIPNNAIMVAGYVNGKWPSYPELVTLFPHATHVSIAVSADATADVLDVEQFDATPEEAPAWCSRMRNLKRIPTVYMNLATWAQVMHAFTTQKINQPNYWIADYTGKSNILVGVDGVVAVQFQNTPGYDISQVVDYWPGIDNPEDEMPTAQEVADAILNKKVTVKDYDGKEVSATIQSYIINSDLHGQANMNAIAVLTKKLQDAKVIS